LISHHQLAVLGWRFAEITGLGSADVVLNYSPFHHVAAKFQTLGCLLAGCRMVIRERLSVGHFWTEVRRYGITHVVAIGGVCHMLYAKPRRADDAENSLRVVYAVPAPAEIYEAFEQRFGVKLVEAYGSTETNLVVATSLEESDPGTCGRRSPLFELRVADADDREVPPGEVGEVQVRAADPLLLSAGYDDMPETTEEAWRGGWFHTGDRGTIDADGAETAVAARVQGPRRLAPCRARGGTRMPHG
jgi:crotonobetaine/carnitine-CoA ligase